MKKKMKSRRKLSVILLVLLLGSIIPVCGISGMTSSIKEARRYAEEKLLPLDGIAGISQDKIMSISKTRSMRRMCLTK